MSRTRKRLFYDIETSFCEGHFWRPGYNQTIRPDQILKHAKIICISWKWEGKDKIHNIHWGLNEQCDKIIIEKIVEQLDKADEIVAHNGDRFDIKWIRTRAAFHDIPMRPYYRMIDTYKISKSLFGGAMPSHSLANLAKYFGLVAKKDPGGLQTWIDIIIHRSRKALKTMVYYCDGDITTLEAVFKKLRKYAPHKFHYAIKAGEGKFHCPECILLGAYNKGYVTKAGTPKHYMKCRDKECGQTWDINNKSYMDFLNFKMVNGIK